MTPLPHEAAQPYHGLDLREGNLRSKLTTGILYVLQEKKFKQEVRALAGK